MRLIENVEVRSDLATRKVLPFTAIFYVGYFDNPFDLFPGRWDTGDLRVRCTPAETGQDTGPERLEGGRKIGAVRRT
jgi:hypothetical protein